MAASQGAGRKSSRMGLFLFLPLAFALSWYPWLLVLAGREGDGGPNPLGIMVAALIASAVSHGWRGPMSILSGIVHAGSRPLFWLIALLGPVVIVAMGLVLAQWQGLSLHLQQPNWPDLLDRFLTALLFVALGEEPGWRGYLLPALQARTTPAAATLMIGAVWSIWHLPLMGGEFAWSIVPAFVATVFAGAVILTWMYNVSGGSVLLPMLFHAVKWTRKVGPGA